MWHQWLLQGFCVVLPSTESLFINFPRSTVMKSLLRFIHPYGILFKVLSVVSEIVEEGQKVNWALQTVVAVLHLRLPTTIHQMIKFYEGEQFI